MNYPKRTTLHPNVVCFSFDKLKGVAVYTASMFFSLGWWVFIDALISNIKSGEPKAYAGVEDWISGVLVTMGMPIVLVALSRLKEDDGSLFRHYLLFFIGAAIAMGGVAGSVTILVFKYITQNDRAVDPYLGVSQVIQSVFIFVSLIILSNNTKKERTYIYCV
ncbi:hypothetical protein BDF14DRAFT_1816618 [Spinellus fusiger]|nr:hypothetical protein BDF14DRAFT_1816618 [Spinellus fusiger]